MTITVELGQIAREVLLEDQIFVRLAQTARETLLDDVPFARLNQIARETLVTQIVVVQLGQIVREALVSTSFNYGPVIRFYSFAAGSFALQNTLTITPDRTGIGRTGETIWVLGPTSVPMMKWKAPFHLAPILSGWLSIYDGVNFHSAIIGVEHMPSAVAWAPDGTVWAVTTENDLYHISASGTILASSVLPPYLGQESGTPLGASALYWWSDGHLYAASAFNGLLMQVE